jgi:type IV conjugative transfer system protein TraL
MEPFPRYLSAPLQILWWDPDEFGAIMIGFLCGVILGGFAWFSIIAVPVLYKRVKADRPRGFPAHLSYSLALLTFEGYPPFFEERFFE